MTDTDTSPAAVERLAKLDEKLQALVEIVADLYRLHLRRGPAWDHPPTKEIMEKARATLAEITNGNDT